MEKQNNATIKTAVYSCFITGEHGGAVAWAGYF